MSDKKQSSVEWLVDNIELNILWTAKSKEIFKQAIAMHKEEIEEAWDDGCYQSSDFPKTSDAEQYYNETFEPLIFKKAKI